MTIGVMFKLLVIGFNCTHKEILMYKKILVPLDGSEVAEAVLPHAEALAKSENAELIIMRVPVLPAAEYVSLDPIIASTVRKDIRDEASKYVNHTVDKLARDRIKAVGITKEGPVPDTILEVAEETHADMIAMSTHGRTGIKRWLMGSVADKIVHHTHIPVMLIHPN
jgi:nucleotide-binding universal stress UspA family protein